MTTATREVTFSIEQTTADGKQRAGGDTASIPAAEARELIRAGRARAASGAAQPKSTPKKRAAAKKAPAKKAADPGKNTPPSSDEGASNEEGNAS